MDPQLAVLRPYADYLEDLGLDTYSVSVVRDGGYATLDGRSWVKDMDYWTWLHVNSLLSPPR